MENKLTARRLAIVPTTNCSLKCRLCCDFLNGPVERRDIPFEEVCRDIDACFDLIVEERCRVGEVNYGMCEEDIAYIMSQPYTMIGSDGEAASLDHGGQPHPRWYGTFPRVIARYCRERKLFPLETAIFKMTGLPACRLGLQNRGLIREGMQADLVLFDFDEIEDTPTYENPKQPCRGIRRVYVNGALTALDGVHTGARNGHILRKGRNA